MLTAGFVLVPHYLIEIFFEKVYAIKANIHARFSTSCSSQYIQVDLDIRKLYFQTSSTCISEPRAAGQMP
jgi:hypothetical protein